MSVNVGISLYGITEEPRAEVHRLATDEAFIVIYPANDFSLILDGFDAEAAGNARALAAKLIAAADEVDRIVASRPPTDESAFGVHDAPVVEEFLL